MKLQKNFFFSYLTKDIWQAFVKQAPGDAIQDGLVIKIGLSCGFYICWFFSVIGHHHSYFNTHLIHHSDINL